MRSLKTWKTKQLEIHGTQISDADDREIVRDVYFEEDAEQIVNEHNAIVFAIRHSEGWTLHDWRNWLQYHAKRVHEQETAKEAARDEW